MRYIVEYKPFEITNYYVTIPYYSKNYEWAITQDITKATKFNRFSLAILLNRLYMVNCFNVVESG